MKLRSTTHMGDVRSETSLPTRESRDHLLAAARLAAERSYSPYSRFRVGAAILLTSGEIVTGCNVENCSYRLTCCAEQSAVTRAVVEHGPTMRVVAVAIANLNSAASLPRRASPPWASSSRKPSDSRLPTRRLPCLTPCAPWTSS